MISAVLDLTTGMKATPVNDRSVVADGECLIGGGVKDSFQSGQDKIKNI